MNLDAKKLKAASLVASTHVLSIYAHVLYANISNETIGEISNSAKHLIFGQLLADDFIVSTIKEMRERNIPVEYGITFINPRMEKLIERMLKNDTFAMPVPKNN